MRQDEKLQILLFINKNHVKFKINYYLSLIIVIIIIIIVIIIIIIIPNGTIESQNTPPLQTPVSPEQNSNDVQNGLGPLSLLNIDPQSQPELEEINKLKERVLVQWIKL